MRDLLLGNAILTAKVANIFDTSVTAVLLVMVKHLDLVALAGANALSLDTSHASRQLVIRGPSCDFGVKYVYLRSEWVQGRR